MNQKILKTPKDCIVPFIDVVASKSEHCFFSFFFMLASCLVPVSDLKSLKKKTRILIFPNLKVPLKFVLSQNNLNAKLH